MDNTKQIQQSDRHSMRRLGKRVAYVLVVVVVVFFIVKKEFLTPPLVQVARVKRQNFTSEVQGTGTITVDQKAAISAKIPGRIAKIFVDQGDFVHPGQLVAILENTDIQRKLQRTRDQLSAAQSSVQAALADEQAKHAREWQAQRDWQREKHLVATGAVSQEEADSYQEQYLTAVSGVRAAVAAVAVTRRNVAAAKADMQFQKFHLSETRLFTYLPGVVVNLPRQPGDAIVPAEPVVTIADPRITMVDAFVDQRFSGELHAGEDATVILRGRENHPFTGRVYRISPQADAGTEEMTAEVEFPLPPRELELGQWADVYINTGAIKSVLVVPDAAVMTMAGRHFVFAVGRNQKLQRVEVKIVANNPRSPLVAVGGNLKAGEQVVLKPMGLKPGEKVSVRRAPSPRRQSA